jgi:hypothetical protein
LLACVDVDIKVNVPCRQTWSDVPVLLCFWHVKRAWLKQLVRKAKKVSRKAIFQVLSTIMLMLMHTMESPHAFDVRVAQALEDFYAQFAQEATFVAYMRRWWHNKRGMF